MKTGRILVAVLAFMTGGVLAWGQQEPNLENGLKAYGSYAGSNIDVVSLSNGNLVVKIPFFSYPQRGGRLGMEFFFVRNAKNWQVVEVQHPGQPSVMRWKFNSKVGPQSSLDVTVARTRVITTDSLGNKTEGDSGYYVETPDGARHWLISLDGTTYRTADTSGFVFTLTRGGCCPNSDLQNSDDSGVLVDRQGTHYNYSGFSGAGVFSQSSSVPGSTTFLTYDPDTAGLQSIVDANGNAIAFPTGGDTLGRFPQGYPLGASNAFPGPSGSTGNVTLTSKNFTISPNFSQPNVQAPPGSPLQVALNDALILPDGSQYGFDYDAYGNFNSITLPSGGSISYLWTEVAMPVCSGITQVSRAVARRTVNDGISSQSWNYTWGQPQQDGTVTNFVMDPNGNETAHVFSPVAGMVCSLYETETRIYQGSHTSGTLLRTVDTVYSGESISDTTSFAGNVVPTSIKTTLASGKVSLVTRQYDTGAAGTVAHTLGDVTAELAYGYGNGAAGALLRETDTSYPWQSDSRYLAANLLDLSGSTVIKDGSGVRVAETDTAYDEAGYLTSYTGALPAGTHGAAPAAVRGNPTTVKHWLNTSNSFVSTHASWYDTGEVYQQVDALGNATTHGYDSAYAGAYSTQTCNALNQCVSGTYDFTTGLITSFTNANATTQASGNTPGDAAHTSTYGYDNMWRLTTGQAPPDPANNSARALTQLTYSAPNSFPLSVRQQRSVTAALNDVTTAFFDGAGRVNHSEHVVPGGPAIVLTTYDGLGQPLTVTNPYFTTSDPSYGVTHSQYDGLGRVMQVTKQDGSISTVSYSDNCTTTTDEAGKQRKSCSDALGRLMEVDEPGDSFAGAAATGQITLGGTLASRTSGGSAATTASATITITDNAGTGGDTHINDPNQQCPAFPKSCPQIWDSGWVQVTVNGTAYRVNYGQSSTDSTLASSLANAINGNASVTASASGGVITVRARTAGAAGNNISLAVASDSNDDADFGGPAFLGSLSGGTLAGGADAVAPVTTWDRGTVSVTIGSFVASTSYGPAPDHNTPAAMVSGLLDPANPSRINRAGSPVSAQGSGATLNLTYTTVGTVGNVGVSAGSSSTQGFPANSFTGTGSLAGGANPGAGTLNNPYVTLYQYDTLGNLLCVEQHGNVTGTGCGAPATSDATSSWRVRRFTYNSLSQLLTAHNPESGTISYVYDANGNVLQKTSPAPNQTNTATQTTSFCYDALNRVTGKAYGAVSCPLSAPVVTYTYDQGTNGIGHLTSLTDQAGSGIYNYDVLGRMSSETRVIAGVSKNLSYSYNLNGILKSVTYPSGATVTYTPDLAGRVLSAVDIGNNINYVTGATYGAGGALTGFVSGSSSSFAGITSSFSFNNRLQPVNISATSPTATVFNLNYDFHLGNGDNGNVYGITNNKDISRNQTFTYDALNRLTSAQSAGTDCSKATLNGRTEYWGNSYTYDAWGNLLTKIPTKCSAENITLTAAANNQLQGYGYDAAGNMTHDLSTGGNYTYDQENRITGAAGYTYTYDADRNRVEKSNGSTGTLYWYMTSGIVAESDLSGNLQSEYVFFDGERVARKDFPAGNISYYFSDNLKTASVITDGSGNIKSESDYYPWGGELQFSNGDSNHYKFTAHERDSETGLDYFGARYYGNSLGRFITPDWEDKATSVPYADFADPQSLNLYSYVRNLPTTRVDLDGHCGDGKSDSSCGSRYTKDEVAQIIFNEDSAAREVGDGSKASLEDLYTDLTFAIYNGEKLPRQPANAGVGLPEGARDSDLFKNIKKTVDCACEDAKAGKPDPVHGADLFNNRYNDGSGNDRIIPGKKKAKVAVIHQDGPYFDSRDANKKKRRTLYETYSRQKDTTAPTPPTQKRERVCLGCAPRFPRHNKDEAK